MTAAKRQAEAQAAEAQASITAAKATMYALAEQIRTEFPDATVAHLSQSDQGEWLWVDTVDTPNMRGLDLESDDGLASSLYTDIWMVRELYDLYDTRGKIDYTPRMGLTSFQLDVAKVLAELGKPEPVSVEFKGVKVTLHDSTTIPGAVSVQIDTEDAEGQKVRVMLNDGDLFIGDPNTEEHPWSALVQEYYDRGGVDRLETPGKTYDHKPYPDDLPDPGDRCKTCGEDITWMGPGQYDYLHVDDKENR